MENINDFEKNLKSKVTLKSRSHRDLKIEVTSSNKIFEKLKNVILCYKTITNVNKL